MRLKEFLVVRPPKNYYPVEYPVYLWPKFQYELYVQDCKKHGIEPDCHIYIHFDIDDDLVNDFATATDILKAIYERQKKLVPQECYDSWDECMESGTIDIVVEAMQQYARAKLLNAGIVGGMWIKPTAKYPSHDWHLCRQGNRKFQAMFTGSLIADVAGKCYNPDEIEYLAELVDDWISVHEGLPEDGQLVDAWNGYVNLRCWFKAGTNQFERFVDVTEGERVYVVHYSNITHWRRVSTPVA